MSKLEKLKERFIEKPARNDMTIEEVITLLTHYDYHLDRNNGSHYIFTPNDRKSSFSELVVPTVNGRFVKAHYIEEIVKVLGLK